MGLKRLMKDARSDPKAICAAVVFEQTITGDVYDSPINDRRLTLAKPGHYTHKLSGVMHMIRIILPSTASSRDQERDAAKLREYFGRFLVDGSFSVVGQGGRLQYEETAREEKIAKKYCPYLELIAKDLEKLEISLEQDQEDKVPALLFSIPELLRSSKASDA